MKKIVMMILLTTLMINSTLAQTATGVSKGEIVPFDGLLMTYERADKAAKAEKKVIVLSDLRIAQEELTEFHRQDARVQRRNLTNAKFNSYLNVLGSFLVGVLVTSFAFKVNQKIGDI